MRSILFTAVLLSMVACGGGSSTGADANLVGFETSSVGSTGINAAKKKNAKIFGVTSGGSLGRMISQKKIAGYQFDPIFNPILNGFTSLSVVVFSCSCAKVIVEISNNRGTRTFFM